MISLTANGFTLELPNRTHWFFTPAIIKVTKHDPTTLGVIRVIVKNNSNNISLVEARELNTNSVAMFDVSRMMQIAFGEVGNLPDPLLVKSYYSASYEVSVLFISGGGTVTLVDHNVIGVWGSTFYNEPKRANVLTWFTKFPFTVSAVGQNGAPYMQMQIYTNSGSSSLTTGPGYLSSFPIYTVKINGSILLADTESISLQSYQAVTPTNGEILANPLSISIRKDCSTDGVYIRWVDHWGYICYYLFKEVGQEIAFEAESWDRFDLSRTDSIEYTDEGPINDAMRTKRSFTSTKTRSLGVKLVDEEQHTFLMSLLSSPIVEVFDGYEGWSLESLADMSAEDIIDATPIWHRVQVVASKVERGRKPLNDFSVVIQEPTKDYQKL